LCPGYCRDKISSPGFRPQSVWQRAQALFVFVSAYRSLADGVLWSRLDGFEMAIQNLQAENRFAFDRHRDRRGKRRD